MDSRRLASYYLDSPETKELVWIRNILIAVKQNPARMGAGWTLLRWTWIIEDFLNYSSVEDNIMKAENI